MFRFFPAILFLSIISFVSAADFPAPSNLLVDSAAMLSESERAEVASFLNDFERKTSIELAVVTVESVNEMSIEEYAAALFEKWGVGKKGRDNGILLLIAKKERAFRIEVGYGLEGSLNDAKAGRILRDMAPFFQSGEIKSGIMFGVTQIAASVSSEYEDAAAKKSEDKISFMIIFILILVAVIAIIVSAALSKNIQHAIGSVVYFLIACFWGFQSFGVFGLIAMIVLGSIFLIFLSSKINLGGGGLGGFSGGFGGGGFGGFGGGMSGGGGASGRW